MPLYLAIILIVVALLVGLAAGAVIGYQRRKAAAEREIGSAEEEARRIINEAIKSAESKKREATVEAKEQILWGLSQADIVKISDEETQFLWGCGPEEGAKRVLALGVKLVMVTLGPKGCLLQNAQAEFSCGCPKVHPVDTTGAGKYAANETVTLRPPPGRSPSAYMARYAAAAASLSTEISGAIPSIPKKEAVLQKMQEAY